MKPILRQAALIIVLAGLVGLAVNAGLVVRFVKGEFVRGFISAAEVEAVAFIGLDQARDLWQSRQALFIDARAPGLFSAGHIPYAVNIPIDEPDREALVARLGLDRAAPVVVYCDGGSCLDSLYLAKWLSERKVCDDIQVYQGGWEEWHGAGLPVEGTHDPE